MKDTTQSEAEKHMPSSNLFSCFSSAALSASASLRVMAFNP